MDVPVKGSPGHPDRLIWLGWTVYQCIKGSRHGMQTVLVCGDPVDRGILKADDGQGEDLSGYRYRKNL